MSDSFETRFIRMLRSVLFFPGLLMGKDSIRECMNDGILRSFFGNTLYYEFMPSIHLEKDETERVAVLAVNALLEDSRSMTAELQNEVHSFPAVVDVMETYLADQGEFPKGICLSMVSLVFALASLRRENGGYTLMLKNQAVPVEPDEELASRFSHLSADMPAEDLSYAALADVTLWGEDLRRIDGLEEELTKWIRLIQMTGFANVLSRLTEH